MKTGFPTKGGSGGASVLSPLPMPLDAKAEPCSPIPACSADAIFSHAVDTAAGHLFFHPQFRIFDQQVCPSRACGP